MPVVVFGNLLRDDVVPRQHCRITEKRHRLPRHHAGRDGHDIAQAPATMLRGRRLLRRVAIDHPMIARVATTYPSGPRPAITAVAIFDAYEW